MCAGTDLVYNPAMPPITVVVIDDHPLIHDAVGHQLAKYPGEFQLVATGTAGEQIEPLVSQHQPDILLLDLGLPPKPGTTIREAGRYPVLPAVRRLRQRHAGTQIVILSADTDASLVEGALSVDAKGYLLKDDELSTQLADALRAVSKGGVYFSTEVLHQIMARKPVVTADLTQRQIEILKAIALDANLPYSEHARNLGITEGTLHNHLRTAFEKLGAKNVTFAIVRAMQLGIIPPHDLGLRVEGSR